MEHGDELNLVTGGTGLLGSHIVERLVGMGRPVRVLVRPSSETGFVRSLGVDVFVGDLADPSSCRHALAGVKAVYHAAAKVGDWGQWEEFRRDCLVATDCLAREAIRADVDRFVQISSTSAYGHPRERGGPIEESEALGQNLWWIWDDYTRSKVECERIAWGLHERDGLRLTVIRPSWLYGERDRTSTERIVRKLERGGIPLIGRGDNPLSAIYAGCVAEAAIAAADDPGSVGEAYNITDQGSITQRQFFTLWAEALGASPPRRRINYRLVYGAALAMEAAARLARREKPPLISRYATWLMGRYLSYSTMKARTKLGWAPSLTYRQSIERTVGWFLASRGRRRVADRAGA
jgi:nucleoside-diphosphate-sugar epimerase